MATLQDLENAIDNLLEHPLGPGSYQLVRQVEEKAYEAFAQIGKDKRVGSLVDVGDGAPISCRLKR